MENMGVVFALLGAVFSALLKGLLFELEYLHLKHSPVHLQLIV